MRKKNIVGVLGVVFFLFAFSAIFFYSANQVEASCSYWCCDRGPEPGSGSDCGDKVDRRQADDNGDCAEPYMGYDDNGVDMCCSPYYGYGDTCGGGGGDVPCTACVPVCQAPLLGTEKLDIYKVPKAFSCTDSEPAGCTGGKTRYTKCWEEPSPQPTISLFIHPENLETSLGFTSDTHTGGGTYSSSKDDSVNDVMPYSSTRYSKEDNTFYMNAGFVDTDLKIEAIYVWFTQNSTKPLTPKKLDLDSNVTPLKYGTNSKSDFGFMMNYRDDQWVPYVPAINGDGDDDTDWWKKAGDYKKIQVVDGKSVFSIPGKNGEIIANVVIYSITRGNDGKTVELKLGISFKETEAPYYLLDKAANEGKYSIWLMANDKFGFTPYDNYTQPASVVTAIHNRWKTNERIRFYDQWLNTGQSWNIDYSQPAVNFSIEPNDRTSLKLMWEFVDKPTSQFSDLIINLYKSDKLIVDGEVKLNNIVSNGGSTDVKSPFDLRVKDNEDIIGHLRYGSENQNYILKISGGSGAGSAILKFSGDIGQGQLIAFATGFDKGGNTNLSSQVTFDLRDWLITQGGLLHSNLIDINVRESQESWWNIKLLDRIKYTDTDLSTELVGIKDATVKPSSPIKAVDTKGYMIRPYLPRDVEGYYSTLKGLFDRRKTSIPNIKDLGNISELSGNLLGNAPGINDIAIGVAKDLRVHNNFVCDRSGVFFVSDKLTIDGEIKGATNTGGVQYLTPEDTSIDQMEYTTDPIIQSVYVSSSGKVAGKGGTVTTSTDGYTYHKFTADGTFSVTNSGNVEALVVGGGGGGRQNYGEGGSSGGGAGGVVSGSVFVSSSVPVTVGAGGAVNSNGKNSVFDKLIGIGGGYGAGASGGAGGTGGSGGGGVPGGLGTSGQGYSGGKSFINAGNANGGGGGGGAGGVGADAGTATSGTYKTRNGGNGGLGTAAYSSWLTATSSGVDVGGVRYVAGGGGGGDYGTCDDDTSGLGGIGGGGRRGSAGVKNTGGGGGGACEYPDKTTDPGDKGGSGLVIVRYPTVAGLLAYSDSSVKTEGSTYSLKGIAKASLSANQTLTRNIATPIDLSNATTVTFFIRSSRTGENIKIGFRDDGGYTIQSTPSISKVNEFQKVTVPLSGIDGLDRDKIGRIIITIVNASSDNTFHIDSIKAQYESIPIINQDKDNRNACIFIVGGEVDIKEGGKSSKSGNLEYDEINAYILADGIINIRKEVGSTIYDGLYINGGLHTLNESGVMMYRNLKLGDRFKYPALVVDMHSKYGVLARTIFGSPVNIQKTEIGIKPY